MASKKYNVVVCGGGSLAHALAGVLGANTDVNVSVFSRSPQRWQSEICVEYGARSELFGKLSKVSDDASDLIPRADLVILAVPHIARKEVLLKIRDYVKPEAWVGSMPGFGGFLWEAKSILDERIKIFGLQRVPYVRDKKIYGKRVRITGIRPKHIIASSPSRSVNEIASLLYQLLNLNLVPAPNYLNICLSRSNSVCHPARMYSLLHDWDGFSPVSNRKLKFYGDWDDNASSVFCELDKEMCRASSLMHVDTGFALPVLPFYEVAFKEDLKQKLQKVHAMKNNFIPLIKKGDDYFPDLNSYLFTEDLSYGFIVLKAILSLTSVDTPVFDKILNWWQELSLKKFIVDGKLNGKDLLDISIPQNYGLTDLEKLVAFCAK